MQGYFKWTRDASLIYVDEANRRFKYVSPPYELRENLKMETLEDVMFDIEQRYLHARWTFYPIRRMEDEGLTINLNESDGTSD